MSEEKNDAFLSHKIKLIIAIVTAMTALLATATQGYLAYVDNTKYEVEAQAQKTEKKVDLAYELLKQKVEFQDRQIEKISLDIGSINRMLIMGNGYITGMGRAPVARRDPHPEGHTEMFLGGENNDDDDDDNDDNDVAVEEASVVVDVQVVKQRQSKSLPATLDEAM